MNQGVKLDFILDTFKFIRKGEPEAAGKKIGKMFLKILKKYDWSKSELSEIKETLKD